jgi:hypothetical protein
MQRRTFTLLAGLMAAAVLTACNTPGIGGGRWQVLFDGTSTEAFRGYRQSNFPQGSWVVQNGALRTVPGRGGADIMTREQYENYDLQFEWLVTPGGNSGVMYNVAEIDAPSWHTGPEFQILDDDRHPDGRNPKTSAGSLYALIAPNEKKQLRPVGEFNTARLVKRGNRVEHWLNGAKVLEYEWGSPEVRQFISTSKFHDLPRFMREPGGYIVFQHHGEEVAFRNIRIRRL